MSKTKKILAIVLALAVALALSCTAFAGTITIQNGSAGEIGHMTVNHVHMILELRFILLRPGFVDNRYRARFADPCVQFSRCIRKAARYFRTDRSAAISTLTSTGLAICACMPASRTAISSSLKAFAVIARIGILARSALGKARIALVAS